MYFSKRGSITQHINDAVKFGVTVVNSRFCSSFLYNTILSSRFPFYPDTCSSTLLENPSSPRTSTGLSSYVRPICLPSPYPQLFYPSAQLSLVSCSRFVDLRPAPTSSLITSLLSHSPRFLCPVKYLATLPVRVCLLLRLPAVHERSRSERRSVGSQVKEE